MNAVAEEWRDVPGSSTLQVSNLGRKKLRGKIKPTKGWVWVQNRGPTKIAVLVLELFVGPCPEGMECCHRDDNRFNNSVTNLRWDTHKSNMQDRSRNGKSNSLKIRGENHYDARLTEELVKTARRLHAECPSIHSCQALAKQMGVSPQSMRKVLKRLSWRHVI